MAEVEPTAKKRAQNKNKKKQSTRKGGVNTGKQMNSSKGPAKFPTAGLNNGSTLQNQTRGSSGLPSRSMMNTPHVSALGTSIPAPPVSMSGATASVYGYGGLPIAPPPNGNTSNFLATSTHIPPAQRAGPYIPYFPQPCKPS